MIVEEVVKKDRKCFTCARTGHFARDCTQRNANAKGIGKNEKGSTPAEDAAMISDMVRQVRSCGVKDRTSKSVHKANNTVRKQLRRSVKLLVVRLDEASLRRQRFYG